jgi:hypothetical protein
MTQQVLNTLRTPAWLLTGIANKPGVLELGRGRHAFTAGDGRVFEAALADVTNINFPWYYFGGGVKLQVDRHKYRISFVRPNGGDYAAGRLLADTGGVAGAAAGLLTAGLTVRDIGSGRQAGKAWRAALAV